MKHLHFIGIGGMGMGTLASLMLFKGYQVSGSDIKENQLTFHLKRQGALIHIGHSVGNIDHPDRVIYSSAIKRDNPEIREARRQKIPIQRRAKLLAQLVNAQTGITVAGAHGKTTTTAMIAQLLLNADLNPTTMVGGIVRSQLQTFNNPSFPNALVGNPDSTTLRPPIPTIQSGFRSRYFNRDADETSAPSETSVGTKTFGGDSFSHLGSGKYFVAEVDESDGSFLFFKPTFSVVTNIDYEHLDYYKNWKNILKAYQRFLDQTKKGGCVFAYGDDQRLRTLLSSGKIDFFTYGIKQNNDLRAGNIVPSGHSASFDCFLKRKKLGTIRLNVPGEHNVLNALACVAVGQKLGIDFRVIQESLKGFRGVERRFQWKADIADILVVDDYGHHPTEIIPTLKTARSFGKKRLITVFQPHRYSRTKYLWKEFVHSLALSDYLILTDIYAASEKPMKGVTAEKLFEEMKAHSTPPPPRFNPAGQEAGSLRVNSLSYLKKEEICSFLLGFVRSGDIVVFLGAGDITHVCEDFVKQLKKSVIPECPAGAGSRQGGDFNRESKRVDYWTPDKNIRG